MHLWIRRKILVAAVGFLSPMCICKSLHARSMWCVKLQSRG